MRQLSRLVILVALTAACEAPGTELLVPLTVLNWYPSGNATCVPRDTGVFVSFSVALRPETVTEQSVQLFEGATPVPAIMSHDADTATIVLWPVGGLRWQTVYDVRVDASLEALFGATLGTAVQSRFSTQPQLGCLGG